ncbi:MAG: DUF309 domain-containing protein [Synechococcaceae cyanobacterium SM2_3_1]|nr:DUF309 domain-containing protein [Synechococcaceae cyanobacterium SM2_3_1]
MQDSDFLKCAVDQFNAAEYYACHDTLEALWTEALDPERRFYQGLLQAAVAYYHLERGNWRGAVLLLGESIAKLEDYCPTFAHLNVEALVEENQQNLTQLQNLGPDQLSALTESPRPLWHWRPHESD